MDYARFSSDNWKSDIHCFADEEDEVYRLLIAGKRYSNADTLPSTLLEQLDALGERDLVPIGLPYDNRSLAYTDADKLISKLLELREMGYHIPDETFERLNDERRNLQGDESGQQH